MAGAIAALAICAGYRAAVRWRRYLPFPAVVAHVPGEGRIWSEAQYPEQYDAANVTHIPMHPVERDDPEFLDNQRFLDVAGRAYSREFIQRFGYDSESEWRPAVMLSYLKRAETFVGSIEASGLKPNFAYQVKLVGDPADRTAFERIGRLGRWSLPIDSTNISDRQYAAFPDKHAAGSYLFFDFFVTDEQGRAMQPLYADSSLHVLFNADHQRRPRRGDSVPVDVFLARPEGVYANPHAEACSQRLYAEAESGSASGNRRPPIGRAFLPPGVYRATLELTEESFHGFGDGGFWTSVLEVPVIFEITRSPRPPALRSR